MKKTVVILSDYVEISKEGGRLKILHKDRKNSLPLTNIDGILIFGKTNLTSEAISLCIANSIPIVLMSKRGAIKGIITGPNNSAGYNRRIKQAELYFFKKFDIAKYLVKRKILEIEYVFDLDLLELKRAVEKVSDYQALLGIEGVASRHMFSAFGELIRDTDFTFTERNFNPPKDEINALLSFVYTLGLTMTIGLICLRGYDPYISFLHVKRGEHPAFASDLMEIIRPHLTKFVAKLINEKTITKSNFEKLERTFFLKRDAINLIINSLDVEKDHLISLMKEFLLELEEFK